MSALSGGCECNIRTAASSLISLLGLLICQALMIGLLVMCVLVHWALFNLGSVSRCGCEVSCQTAGRSGEALWTVVLTRHGSMSHYPTKHLHMLSAMFAHPGDPCEHKEPMQPHDIYKCIRCKQTAYTAHTSCRHTHYKLSRVCRQINPTCCVHKQLQTGLCCWECIRSMSTANCSECCNCAVQLLPKINSMMQAQSAIEQTS